MKKIVLVNQSTGYLMIDIVNAYAEKYSDVVLLAGSFDTLGRTLNNSVKIHKIVTYVRTSFFLLLFTHCIHTITCFPHTYNIFILENYSPNKVPPRMSSHCYKLFDLFSFDFSHKIVVLERRTLYCCHKISG